METNYIGCELSDAECDLIALSRFSKSLFDGESELQQICFFDYRYLHPVKRTYLFAHEYVAAYKALYAQYIDIDNEQIYGLSRPNDPLDNQPPRHKTAKLRTPTCLWRARQVSDGLCIPYDFYARTALKRLFQERYHKVLLGTNANNKVRLNIQASALYSDAIIAHVQEKWEEYQRARMIWSINHRLAFTESESNGTAKPHEYKLAYERYVLKQIMRRTQKTFPLRNALSRRALRRKLVEKHFAAELEDAG